MRGFHEAIRTKDAGRVIALGTNVLDHTSAAIVLEAVAVAGSTLPRGPARETLFRRLLAVSRYAWHGRWMELRLAKSSAADAADPGSSRSAPAAPDR